MTKTPKNTIKLLFDSLKDLEKYLENEQTPKIDLDKSYPPVDIPSSHNEWNHEPLFYYQFYRSQYTDGETQPPIKFLCEKTKEKLEKAKTEIFNVDWIDGNAILIDNSIFNHTSWDATWTTTLGDALKPSYGANTVIYSHHEQDEEYLNHICQKTNHDVYRFSQLAHKITPNQLKWSGSLHIDEWPYQYSNDGFDVKQVWKNMSDVANEPIVVEDEKDDETAYTVVSEVEENAYAITWDDTFFVRFENDEPIFLTQAQSAKTYGNIRMSSIAKEVNNDLQKIRSFERYADAKLIRLSVQKCWWVGEASAKEIESVQKFNLPAYK